MASAATNTSKQEKRAEAQRQYLGSRKLGDLKGLCPILSEDCAIHKQGHRTHVAVKDWTAAQAIAFRDNIWPHVQQVRSGFPTAHAAIVAQLIALTVRKKQGGAVTPNEVPPGPPVKSRSAGQVALVAGLRAYLASSKTKPAANVAPGSAKPTTSTGDASPQNSRAKRAEAQREHLSRWGDLKGLCPILPEDCVILGHDNPTCKKHRRPDEWTLEQAVAFRDLIWRNVPQVRLGFSKAEAAVVQQLLDLTVQCKEGRQVARRDVPKGPVVGKHLGPGRAALVANLHAYLEKAATANPSAAAKTTNDDGNGNAAGSGPSFRGCVDPEGLCPYMLCCTARHPSGGTLSHVMPGAWTPKQAVAFRDRIWPVFKQNREGMSDAQVAFVTALIETVASNHVTPPSPVATTAVSAESSHHEVADEPLATAAADTSDLDAAETALADIRARRLADTAAKAALAGEVASLVAAEKRARDESRRLESRVVELERRLAAALLTAPAQARGGEDNTSMGSCRTCDGNSSHGGSRASGAPSPDVHAAVRPEDGGHGGAEALGGGLAADAARPAGASGGEDDAGERCSVPHSDGGSGSEKDVAVAAEDADQSTGSSKAAAEVEPQEEDEPHSDHRREENPVSSDDVDGYCF